MLGPGSTYVLFVFVLMLFVKLLERVPSLKSGRFSTRDLLVAMTVVALILGWVVFWTR